MQIRLDLVCHPATPAMGVTAVYAFVSTLGDAPDERYVWFNVHADAPLRLPGQAEAIRTDGLWRSTCFELFIMPTGSDSYVEYNLSPSFAWAAYQFDSYRSGGRDLPLTFDPEIWLSPTDGRHVSVEADFDVSFLHGRHASLGLSAVIELKDGTKSYWALAHAPGPPDFHNPACFVATLPAPEAP